MRRGANPSASQIPYPALCFAVAAGDTKIVKLLLEKGANCNDKMPMKVSLMNWNGNRKTYSLIFIFFFFF